MKSILFVVSISALLLGACSVGAAPTADPQQIQASAIAAANTMIAQTVAAIPTTQVPSDTPQPSATPTFPPTLEIPTALLTTPTTQSSGGDNCNHLLQMSAAGPKHPTVVSNQTGAPINLSLGLWTPNVFGECGYIGNSMGKNETWSIGLPSGDWFAYAWASGAKSFTVKGYFSVQVSNMLKMELCIKTGIVKYAQSC